MRRALATLVFVTACGTSAVTPAPPSPTSSTPPTTTAPLPATTAPRPAATTLVQRGTPVPATPVVIGPPLDPVLMDVITGRKIPTYKATYVLKQGADALGGTTTQTYVFRTPEYRFDYSMTVLGITQNVTTIAGRTAFYVCLSLFANNACYEAPLAELERASEQFYRPLDELASRLDEIEIRRSGSVTAAGRVGTCLDFTPKPGTATFSPMTICYTSEGIPLQTRETTAYGLIVMEATAVSTQVADADFVPPYPVTKLPTASPSPAR